MSCKILPGIWSRFSIFLAVSGYDCLFLLCLIADVFDLGDNRTYLLDLYVVVQSCSSAEPEFV